jgi:hypothetical protein
VIYPIYDCDIIMGLPDRDAAGDPVAPGRPSPLLSLEAECCPVTARPQ